MKFPDYRLSMEAALPSSVDIWLGQELEQRGIDSLIYTRYIISILRQDIEDPDIIEKDIDLITKYKNKADFGKRNKKAERKKFSISDEERKKVAAIECLSAISEEKAGIENLVEELCIRLKDSQIQESASPVSTVVTLHTDSSEDSGAENQNPAQRYYAAFPSLHDQSSPPAPPQVSPTVPVEGAWRHNPLIKHLVSNETSEEDISSANEDAEIKKINKLHPVIVPRNKKIRKNNSHNNNNNGSSSSCGKNIKDGCTDQHKNRSRSQSHKVNYTGKKAGKDKKNIADAGDQFPDWPPGFAKKDTFLLQNLAIVDEDYMLTMRTKISKRPNEELCTRVESLLKGMLLPMPEKTYKELQDVEEDVPEAKHEKIAKPSKVYGLKADPLTKPAVAAELDFGKDDEVNSKSPVSRDGSVSPDLQEQEFWYTQPIDVVFQSQDDEDPTLSSKLRLYKRNSYPTFSPDSDCTKDSNENENCLLSSASSPVFERNRSLSFASQCSDDIWNGSVLIPGWLTEELSVDSDTIADKVAEVASISSSFKASSPYPNMAEAESLFSLEVSFGGNRSFTDTGQGVELTELDVFSTTLGPQHGNLSCNQKLLASSSVDSEDWKEGKSSSLLQLNCQVDDWAMEKIAQDVIDTPEYCSHPDWMTRVDNNITPTPVEQPEFGNTENKETPAEAVCLVDLEYLTHLYEDAGWNLFPVDETIKISSPKRISLPNIWQGISSYEPLFDFTGSLDFEDMLCWQPLSYGESSLSQLWDVNMQKRNKFSSWGCPNIFSDSWKRFGDSSQYLSDFKEFDVASGGNKNTLIPTISIDLLTDNTVEASQVDDWFSDFDPDMSRHLNRSISLGNVPLNWPTGNSKIPDPKLSKSFELVPSEHSAFCDVSKKLLHVHSEPNLTQLRHDFDKDAPRTDSSTGLEHLYFSPKTHFRPITPAYAPELSCSKSKQLVCNDLFGGIPTTKTPYLQYHMADGEVDEDGFCPKFKVKNYSKGIQTGDSLDKSEEDRVEVSDPDEDERDTPETLTLEMIENIMGEKDGFEPLVSIADDLDTANTDSAYETDYGISALENEQENGAGKQYYQSECCHNADTITDPFYSHPSEDYDRPLGEVKNFTVESFAATFPHTQDWPHMQPSFSYLGDQQSHWSSGASSTYSMQGWPTPQHQPASEDLQAETLAISQQPIHSQLHDQPHCEPQCQPLTGSHSQVQSLLHYGSAEALPTWNSSSSWCGDLITDHLYDESDAERYKDIWSTGQESFTIIDFSVPHPFDQHECNGTEYETGQIGGSPNSGVLSQAGYAIDGELADSDNCHYDMIFNFGDSPTEDGSGVVAGVALSAGGDNAVPVVAGSSLATEEVNPNQLADSGFQCVRLVYKDKQRTAMDRKSSDHCYGDYDLMPMPNEALMSTDLEKEWLTRDFQAFWIHGRPSSLQRKPCSFFLEGNCRRADCKFAHDISNITCRFWEEGTCFKGDLCPFLHGFPRLESSSTSPDDDPSPVPEEKHFSLSADEFPELSLSVKNGNTNKARRSKQVRSHGCSGSGNSRKDKNGRKGGSSRRHSNKENHVAVKILERCSSSI